ncbi:MAG: hypothetical protein OXG99_04905, partial [Alphaproteobacteria bacterium]|nr:hypothetical protein [Alphaproteobacteria bacterium]
GSIRADTPRGQIRGDLEQHRLADDATIGILTDGRVWRIHERRSGPDGRVVVALSAEYVLDDAGTAVPSMLERQDGARALANRLGAATFEAVEPPAPLFPEARRFLAEAIPAVRDGRPAAVLKALCGQDIDPLEVSLPEAGLIADAKQHDWEPGFIVGQGPSYIVSRPVQGSLLGPPRIRMAAVPFRDDEGAGGPSLRKGDIALCARAFAHGDDPLVLCTWAGHAHEADVEKSALRMRLALHAGGRTSMTPEFDPDLPPASVLVAVDKVAGLLRGPEAARTTARLPQAFDVSPLQEGFYERIEGWLEARLTGRRGDAKDMAMVRHLIRVMFAWILKEHGLVPRSLFDRAFVRNVFPGEEAGPSRYHDDVLRRLFHEALNVPPENRVPHENGELRVLFDNTPFLNGSIFARHPDDGAVRLQESDYWGDGDGSGLYDTLSAFQWTLDEHSAQVDDLALDPELLGTLFERLVSLVDHSAEPRRKPKGTYYTPRDVVAVMVSDALVARMLREEDLPVSEAELRQLFSETDSAVPRWSGQVRRQVCERLRQLTVFDPAVGSGVFLLGALECLMTAFAKLDVAVRSGPRRGELIRAVIRDQLHGGDIQPLASQIAKLRLFLAIEAAEGKGTAPLPNLEARIVNADALGTVPDPAWRPGAAEQLLETDPEFQRLLAGIVANRADWFEAHAPDVKERLLVRDRELRVAFAERVGTTPVSDRYRSFAEWAPLEHGDSVADTDPRLIFSRDPWSGFDIVIANPPYGRLSKEEAKRALDRDYRSAGARRSEALFVELAMVLARRDRGVVQLVLPLGISFRQDHAGLRAFVEAGSQRVDLRHFDMTPGTIFNTMPTVKDWANKQRIVLFTAWRGEGGQIRTTGLQRWSDDSDRGDRAACLASRQAIKALHDLPSSVDRRISLQWLRTPTTATKELLLALLRQRRSVGDLSSARPRPGLSLGLPQTGYQYVPALPLGTVAPRNENPLHFRDEEDRLLALAALNGHVFYGWWLMTGDGFHVSAWMAVRFGLPDAWMHEGPERKHALGLAWRLIDAIPDCTVSKLNAGERWYNADYFSGAPDLVEELDRLHIGSLGLPVEPLLRDLRTLRSNSSWRLGNEPAG